MINLVEETNKYIQIGYDELYASAKVAQDIILNYLFKSEYKNNITIKGGVVMSNITNDIRRATIDIDLDLIKIYLNDDNLHEIFSSHKLKGIEIIVDKEGIVNLKHQDYKGKRIPILIRDTFKNEINTKIDIGVHTDYNIAQSTLCFNTCIDNESITLFINSKEQIFVEKIIPIIKFGVLSTRYKDYYDLYWLITKGNLNDKEVLKILKEKIFDESLNDIKNINDLIGIVEKILTDKMYLKKLNNRKNNWLEVNQILLKKEIINYLKSIETLEIIS